MILNKDLIELHKVLSSFKNIKSLDFNLKVIRNKKILEEEIKNLQSLVEVKEDFKEYDNQRIALCKSLSELDEDGNPVIEDNTYKIKNQKVFDVEFNKLKEKYKEVIDERTKVIEEYKKLLETEIKDVRLLIFEKEELPKDLTTQQLEGIIKIVNV